MRDVDERALKAREKKAALGPDVDLSTFSTEPFPNESFTGDNNYLLLFDELSGKTLYAFFSGN